MRIKFSHTNAKPQLKLMTSLLFRERVQAYTANIRTFKPAFKVAKAGFLLYKKIKFIRLANIRKRINYK
jgi:hypothetical protein